MQDPLAPPLPWSRRAEALAAVGFWLALGTLAVVHRAVGPWHDDAPMPVGEAVETLAGYGIWALLTPVVFRLVRHYRFDRGRWASRLGLYVGVGVAVALAVGTVTGGLLRPVFSPELAARRPWSFEGMVNELWFLDDLIVYTAVLAAGLARDALVRLRERDSEAARLLADRTRLEAQLTEARLAALRMQLNPHFLFNTLNAVSALVERDPAGVRTMIARLSSLLRRVLDDSGAQHVPLSDELAFLHDYLDVQRVRFRDRLRVEWAVDPGVLGALVPPLVLQPLVENAVGHGVSQIEDGAGIVRLAAARCGDRLVLTVEDNGPGLGSDLAAGAVPGSGVGLANTRARLDALYGAGGVLRLTPAPAGGLRAEVSFPLRFADALGAGAIDAAGDGAPGLDRADVALASRG